jgi:ferredoxin
VSRFGIRKRLKGALGREKPEIIRHAVTYVLPDGTEQIVHAEEGYDLLMASQELPAPISTGRRAGGPCPDGGCGLCRVEVVDGSGLSPRRDKEQATIDAHVSGEPHEGRAREPGPAANDRTRLACHTRIQGGGGRVQVLELFDYDSIRGDPDGT